MDYMVRFVGHVDERKRPEGFPREIYSDIFCRVKNEQELKVAINEQSKVYIVQQCMVVPKEPGRMESLAKPEFDTRMLVPLHLITHITTITTKIVGEIPEINLDGAAAFADGTKATIQ